MQTLQTVPQAPGNVAVADTQRKRAEPAVESVQHVTADWSFLLGDWRHSGWTEMHLQSTVRPHCCCLTMQT